MEFPFSDFLTKPIWMWMLLISLVIALLAFDLGVLNQTDHEIGVLFAGFVWWSFDYQRAAMVHRFHTLKYALSVLLIFIGSKIFVADIMGWEKFPAAWSLGITFTIHGAGVIYSLWKTRGGPDKPEAALAKPAE